MGQLSEDTCFCQSADNQYCMLAKENFSLNLIGRKISGALPLSCMLPPPRYWGSVSRENLLVRAAEPNGVVKRDPCKDSCTTLIILCEPTNQTAVETGLWSLPQSFSFHWCYRANCKLYIPEAGQCAEPSRSQNYARLKCNPAVPSPYQLRPVDAERLLCCYTWVDILQNTT